MKGWVTTYVEVIERLHETSKLMAEVPVEDLPVDVLRAVNEYHQACLDLAVACRNNFIEQKRH